MSKNKSEINKEKLIRAGVISASLGITISLAYVIYQRYLNSEKKIFEKNYAKICKSEYSSNIKVDKLLKIVQTIIESKNLGYLGTTNNGNPCIRMVGCDAKWKPPITIPYIYFGTNKKSRKYSQIEINNNVVLTFGDESGMGYLSLYGKAESFKDINKQNEMFPIFWRLFFPEGPKDKRFVMMKLNIERIEFVSHRFSHDSYRNDWKPFILKRTNDLNENKAEWEIEIDASKSELNK